MGDLKSVGIKPVGSYQAPQPKPVATTPKSVPASAFSRVSGANRLIAKNPGGIVGGTWGRSVTEPVGAALCDKARSLNVAALEGERAGIVAKIEALVRSV